MEASRRSVAKDIAFFVALLATALAMGGALAHALELANKIHMTREDYFVVQKIYQGWDQLAFLLAIEFVAMLAVIVLHRAERRILWPALTAVACLIAAQVIFWLFTFPANQATNNWTLQPDNWQVLRAQWEYSHLAGAAFQVLALAALIVAVLRRCRT